MAFLSTSVHDAAARLRAGKLVSMPTETVYGLAGDASDEAVVQSIFALKGRPAHNPLILHVSSVEMAQRYGQWNALADTLAKQYWAGPLTLVLPRLEGAPVAPQVSAGGATLALRMPAHPVARALIEAFGAALAAPSANRSGRISPTLAAHVLDEFPSADLMVLDGGACEIGLESTVVDCTGDAPVILRSGSIDLSNFETMKSASPSPDAALKSPGLLSSHYAPALPVRLNASEVAANEALLAFGSPLLGAKKTLNLSESGSLEEAAHHLFAMMRALDTPEYQAIAVMPIPQQGIGIAINDRLRRAACR